MIKISQGCSRIIQITKQRELVLRNTEGVVREKLQDEDIPHLHHVGRASEGGQACGGRSSAFGHLAIVENIASVLTVLLENNIRVPQHHCTMQNHELKTTSLVWKMGLGAQH